MSSIPLEISGDVPIFDFEQIEPAGCFQELLCDVKKINISFSYIVTYTKLLRKSFLTHLVPMFPVYFNAFHLLQYTEKYRNK